MSRLVREGLPSWFWGRGNGAVSDAYCCCSYSQDGVCRSQERRRCPFHNVCLLRQQKRVVSAAIEMSFTQGTTYIKYVMGLTTRPTVYARHAAATNILPCVPKGMTVVEVIEGTRHPYTVISWKEREGWHMSGSWRRGSQFHVCFLSLLRSHSRYGSGRPVLSVGDERRCLWA